MKLPGYVLYALVGLGCLASVIASAGPAGAAELRRHRTEWSLIRVGESRAGRKPYCAIAQEFSGDVVITLARNVAGETAFAIDFLKESAFEKGRIYTISLEVEGQEARDYSLAPASPSALVVNLGSDDAFLKGLRDGDALKVGINADSYRFALADVSDLETKLVGCVDDLMLPGKPDRDNLRSASAADSQAESDSEGASSGEMDKLRAENELLKNALRKVRHDLENRLMAAKDSAANIEKDEKIRLLQKEIVSLKTRLKTGEDLPVRAGTEDMAQEVEALEARIAEISGERDTLRARMERMAERVASAEAALAESRSRAQVEKEATHGKAQEELAALRKENARLMRALEDSQERQKAQNGARGKLVSLERELDSARAEAQSRKEALAALRDRHAKLREKATAMQSEIEMLNQQSIQAAETPQKRAMDALRNESENLRNRIAIMESEKKILEQNLADAQKKLEEAAARIGGEQTGAQGLTLAKATERNHELQAEVRRMGARLQETHNSCAREKRELEQMLFDPRLARGAQVAMMRSMEMRLDAARAKVSELDEKEQSCRANMISAQAQIDRLKKQTIAAAAEGGASAGIVAGNEELLAALRDEREKVVNLQAALEDAQAAPRPAPAGVETMARELAQMKEANEKLLSRLEIERADNEALRDELTTPRRTGNEANANGEEIDTLRRTIDSLRAELGQAQGGIKRREERITALKREVNDLHRAMAGAAASTSPAAGLATRTDYAATRRDDFPSAQDISRIEPAAAARPRAADMAAIEPSAAPASRRPPEAAAGNRTSGALPFNTMGEMVSLLRSANISLTGGVQKVSRAGQEVYAGYKWNTRNLYGSAIFRTDSGGENFRANVERYLARARARCPGDFAVAPEEHDAGYDYMMTRVDIACAGADVNSSASLLFVQHDGIFSIFAHEGSSDYMDLAMESRDRLAGILKRSAAVQR